MLFELMKFDSLLHVCKNGKYKPPTWFGLFNQLHGYWLYVKYVMLAPSWRIHVLYTH